MILLREFYLGITCITAVLYVVFFKKRHRYYWLITTYFIVNACLVIIIYIMPDIFKLLNNFTMEVYFKSMALVDFAFWCMVYFATINNKFIRKLILLSMSLFIVGSVMRAFIHFSSVDVLMDSIKSVLLIIWSLFFIRETVILQKETRLQLYPMFWISMGLLFFYVGRLLSIFAHNYLNIYASYIASYPNTIREDVFVMYSIFPLIFYLLCIVGALCQVVFKNKSDILISKNVL